jgi:RNA polymerase sigma-70 factor (ECF subfamily)
VTDKGDQGEGPKSGRTPVETAYIDNQRGLRRFIARMFGRSCDVDDIAQETFLRAVAAERRGRIENPKAYLYQAARNVALTELSKKSRQIVDYIEDATLREVSSEEPSAEAHAIGRERLAMFCEALATLPPQCRKVFLMRKIHGYSHKEISRRLGISVSTVEKHLAAGLTRCAAYIRNQEAAAPGAAADTSGSDRRDPPKNRAL